MQSNQRWLLKRGGGGWMDKDKNMLIHARFQSEVQLHKHDWVFKLDQMELCVRQDVQVRVNMGEVGQDSNTSGKLQMRNGENSSC